MLLTRLRCLAALCMAFAWVGCGSSVVEGGGDGSVDVDAEVMEEADAAPEVCRSRVSGQVRFPNGLMTVSGALVYLTSPGTSPMRTGECRQCIDRSGVHTYALSDVDGSFSLHHVRPGTYDLVVEKGLFERRTRLEVACEDVVMDAQDIALPADAEQGRIPRIAVIKGAHDTMETVLARLGLGALNASGELTRHAFDLYQGADWGIDDGSGAMASDSTLAMLRNFEQLGSYDYLFLNCGVGLEGSGDALEGEEHSYRILQEPVVTENLRRFVHGGGRLFVTDQAYDFVEQVFPSALEFMGGGSAGLTDHAETINAGESGDQVDFVLGDVVDDTLRNWLGLHGQLNSANRVPLLHFMGGWVGVNRTHERVRTWVHADIAGRSSMPLTVTIGYGCGQVLFTSYHTTQTEPMAAPAPLNAQEMILGYLAIEIGACVDEPAPI